ncbi:MAG: glycosyltransferase family 25 protein [Neisseriaceae bacterium]|nr:glycosyltransferase family 25 protein [Neisseriaceae bacterium]
MNLTKTFILSLPDAVSRRQSASNQCKQYDISFEWVDAFNFRNKSQEEVSHYYQPTDRAKQKNRFLSNTEIACALGHQKIYEMIITQNIPFSLVLEDDFKFIDNPLPLLSQIDHIQKNTNFDILILGYVKLLEKDLAYHYRRLPIKHTYSCLNYQFGQPWVQFSCGTVAYVITQKGAQKLKSDIIRVTADDWLYFEQHNNADILHVRPLIILEDCENFQSDIRNEKKGYLEIKNSSYIIRSAKGMMKNFLMNGLKWKQ